MFCGGADDEASRRTDGPVEKRRVSDWGFGGWEQHGDLKLQGHFFTPAAASARWLGDADSRTRCRRSLSADQSPKAGTVAGEAWPTVCPGFGICIGPSPARNHFRVF